MELMLMRMFQHQVKLQCEFALAAYRELEIAIRDSEITGCFYAIQNFLNACANLSKALWGQKGKKLNDRLQLRQSIGVQDDSPLRDTDMRNNYEHFDERLEHWWNDSAQHNHIDLMLGPRAAIVGAADIDRFRAYDPDTAQLVFWGDDFNIRALFDEIRRIYAAVCRESAKPHWVA